MLFSEPKIPQSETAAPQRRARLRFSALQRAENSSMVVRMLGGTSGGTVSVLFSEPKIPQFHLQRIAADRDARVSVLFSEPKIPQSGTGITRIRRKTQIVSVLFSEPKIPQ